jgi:hypothetical protein
MTLAAWIARQLGGARRVGKQWRCRCPCHKDHHPSLDIVDRDGDVLWICRAGCDGREIGRELYRLGLRPDLDRAGDHGAPRALRKSAPAVLPDRAKLDWLLSRLRPIAKTPVTRYLAIRGLDLPPEGHHLRYLPANPPKFIWPCMVGVITAFDDPERILSLHFTRLRPDGLGKAPLPKNKQRSYLKGFSKKHGVIRLCHDADVTVTLGVAEGVETSLAVSTSFRRAKRDQPVWAALDAGNMAELPVVPGIETLVAYADKDAGGTGRRAAQQLATRWARAGREAYIALPDAGDWNERDVA